MEQLLHLMQEQHAHAVADMARQVTELQADRDFLCSERDAWREAARRAGVAEWPKTTGKLAQQDMDAVRRGFEHWATGFYDLAPADFARTPEGGYQNGEVQARWMGWMHCARLAPRQDWDPARAIGWYCYNRVTGKTRFTTAETEAVSMAECKTGHWEVTALGPLQAPVAAPPPMTELVQAVVGLPRYRCNSVDEFTEDCDGRWLEHEAMMQALEPWLTSGSTWRCRDCGGALGEAHDDMCGIGQGLVTRMDVGDSPIPDRPA
jgi:hypothetical protein